MLDNSTPLLVALDIGTSGVRAVAFTPDGISHAEGRASLTSSYPESGAAEQRPEDWWLAAAQSLRQLAAQLGDALPHVMGIGLTGQCPTLACLDPGSGPVGPTLLYQDNRATAEADMLIARFGKQAIHRHTGQAPSAFYLLPKLLWLRRQYPQLALDNLAIVQPRDLIGWHLTGRIATDPTHAACTLAYDLEQQTWAQDWLEELALPHQIWPEILPSCSILGHLTAEAASASGFPTGVPVIIGAADSICTAYGARACEPGVLCEVTGTSTCLHMTIGSPSSLLAVNTYPHILPGLWYAETGLNTTGGALAWLANLLGREPDDLVEQAASISPGSDGLFFVPHLSGGERDAAERRGAFLGLQLGSDAAHLSRAVLEGVAYALRQRVTTLEQAGYAVTRIVSCGGNARSALWAQIKADILEQPISSLAPTDTTTWGAAQLVARTLGIPADATAQRVTEAIPQPSHTSIYRIGYQHFCQLEEGIALQRTGEQQRSIANE